ncbi:MAG: tetratricopeptide repeat protein, partial [Streptosporangiales bacterium]|nr:tetratricopeptide repeat protein [Streptosporangiales bacterium]
MTVAGRFVDFYALLSVAPDAPAETVGEAIAEQRRRWQASSASTAEERVRELDLAELVLLDPDQRADYDDEWRSRSNGAAPPPEQGTNPPAPTPAQAEPPAAEAAAGGTDAAGDGKSGDAWADQARRAAAAGDHARAIDCYHYAVLLQPENPFLHYELGQSYAQAGNYELAYGGFDSAARLAPHVTAYRAALGRALVHLGRPGDAIGVLEQVVAETPTEAAYRYELAQALHDTCVHEMTLLNDGLVCITSADQARLVERLTGRALTLIDPNDQGELAGDVREKHDLARTAMRRTWRPPLPWWVMGAVTAVVVLLLGALITWWAGA